jgi:hypothetical protein
MELERTGVQYERNSLTSRSSPGLRTGNDGYVRGPGEDPGWSTKLRHTGAKQWCGREGRRNGGSGH